MNDSCKVLVFAKAPVAGFAKTRLAKSIGADGAARLASRMLSETVAHAVNAGIGPVEICCAPDHGHRQFGALRAGWGVELSDQGDGDLGQRMWRALERSLRGHRRVLLIGTDAPGLAASVLSAAAAALATHDAVVVPALDGGYVLVGVVQALPGLFMDIDWGTDAVMAQTRRRLVQLGMRHVELPPIADVDEAADLIHVPACWLADSNLN